MAGSQPILQSRHRDTRFGEDDMRPFSVFNGAVQGVPGDSIEGPAVGGSDAITAATRKQALNRVTEFEGEIYWWHSNDIRVSIPGSGWTRGETPTGGRGIDTTSIDTDYAWANIGLFPIITRDGKQELVALYSDSDSASNFGLRRKQSRITGDGTWGTEELIDVDNNIFTNAAPNRCAYNYYAREGNNLYMQWVNNVSLEAQYVKIDLETAVATQLSRAPNPTTASSGTQVHYAETPHVFCGYSGLMWYMYRLGGYAGNLGGVGSRETHWLVERVEGVVPRVELVLMSGLAPDGIATPGIGTAIDWATGRSEMFVDPDQGRMYAMHFVRGSGDKSGWAVHQLRYDGQTDKLYDDGDVGWLTLPPSLRMLDSTSQTINPTSRFKAYNLVDSSGVSTVILEFMATGAQGNLTNWYMWNGPATPMTFLGQGGDASWSRPNIKIGGGHRVWSPRQPYNFACRVDESGASPGTVNVYTRILGSGEPVKVRYLFTSENHPMTKQAQIQNTTSGVITNNEVTGIIANGAEFRVEWLAENQNIPFGGEFSIHAVADND